MVSVDPLSALYRIPVAERIILVFHLAVTLLHIRRCRNRVGCRWPWRFSWWLMPAQGHRSHRVLHTRRFRRLLLLPMRSLRTSRCMLLVLAIAVVLDALVHDLVRHERLDEIVIRREQAAYPLVALDELDVPQDLAAQQLARLEAAHDLGVVAHPALLAVHELQRVDEVGGRHGRRRDGLQDLALFALQAEWRVGSAARLLLLVLVLVAEWLCVCPKKLDALEEVAGFDPDAWPSPGREVDAFRLSGSVGAWDGGGDGGSSPKGFSAAASASF